MFKVFLVAGDPSGDNHAGAVARALRDLCPDAELHGVGGQTMADAGVQLLADQRHMARVGLGGFLSGIPYHAWLATRILKHLASFRPDVVLLIDYGGFNLRLAKALKSKGYRVAYFIPPQVWASRRGRIKSLRANVEHVYAIFPFEEPLYRQADVPVTYVGHPLIGQLPPPSTREAVAAQYPQLDPKKPWLLLLPGSRKFEIQHLLRPMLAAVPAIQRARRSRDEAPLQVVLAQAPALDADWMARQLAAAQPLLEGEELIVLHHATHPLLSTADVTVAASGTVTLEAALYGTPTVLVYKGPPLAYWLARKLIRVPCLGLPNLLTDPTRPIIPELLQHDVTPSRIVNAVLPLLMPQSEARRRAEAGFRQIQEMLAIDGEDTPAVRVARDLLSRFKSATAPAENSPP